jgi:hypothetical protein
MDFNLTTGIEVLERTPNVLRALLDGLSPKWIVANEGPDTWSPFDILGHLIHGERTDWMPRAKIILTDGPSTIFESFDREAMFKASPGKSLETLLEEFAWLRTENLATLNSWQITEAQLELEGRHPALGTVTLRQLLATWVAHDLTHIAQIARVMSKQYREAVGPWREYLPLLDR